jgi:hypothetical protein
MMTCRYGVRPYPDGRAGSSFEVFDRMTGAAVATGMRRVEAEDDARRRNHDTSGRGMTVRLGAREVTVLQHALDVALAFRVAGQDRHILEDLYVLFASWEGEGQ